MRSILILATLLAAAANAQSPEKPTPTIPPTEASPTDTNKSLCKLADSPDCQTALASGGLFVVAPKGFDGKRLDETELYNGTKSWPDANQALKVATPYAEEAIKALERIVARRAQAEAVDWILSQMPKKDSALLAKVIPSAWAAAQDPGYGGLRQNLTSVRKAFLEDLEAIPANEELMNSILEHFQDTAFGHSKLKISFQDWQRFYGFFNEARRQGFSATSLPVLLDIGADPNRVKTLVSLFLSWQKNAGSLATILGSEKKLVGVLQNIRDLSGDSKLDAQKLTQFLVHLHNNSNLLACGRDSIIRVLPTFIDLAAEGAVALGIDTSKFQPQVEKARKVAAIAQLFEDKNYPTAVREILHLYTGRKPLPPRVAAFAGVLDAVASTDTLALTAALERTMSPLGAWKEKHDGFVHLSVTAYAGFGLQGNFETPHKVQYGVKVPMGFEYTWRYLGIMGSALDLGHMMSADGSEVDWTLEDIFTPGLFLRYQPCRAPFLLFGGAEWREENWTALGGVAVDVTLWKL